MSNPSLFPSIGEIASQTEDIDEAQITEKAEGDVEDKVIQEIESLCMKCHEQVSIPPIA